MSRATTACRRPASAIKLATGANALDTARRACKRSSRELHPRPSRRACKVVYPYDTTPFVRMSIEEVVKTLIEAIVLVFLVMFLFLQNCRATLIPTIAVPVVLLGTFGVLAAFGYSDQHADHVRAWCWRSACWSTTRSSWSRTSSA